MFIFTKISRPQLLAVTGWSSGDLDNRAHANQLALAFGCRLPASTGVYVGPDCFACVLTDALVQACGFARAPASRFVLEGHEKWLNGLTRLEWPDAYQPPSTTYWALTKRGLEEGMPPPPPDSNIYFAVARSPTGAHETACGTLLDNTVTFQALIRTAAPGRWTDMRYIGLQEVYERTLESAKKAGVDLGAPFTRPEGHPEHQDWFAAIKVHRALSDQRAKVRNPPGPSAKGKKGKAQKSKARKSKARAQPRVSKSSTRTAGRGQRDKT